MNDLANLQFEEIKAEGEADLLFGRNGFVRTPAFTNLCDDSRRLFVGRKGSGKTAHRLAIRHDGRILKDFVDEIILTDFSPRLFFASVAKVKETIDIEIPILVRNLWRYVIALRLMRVVRDSTRTAPQVRTANLQLPFSNVCEYLEAVGFGPDVRSMPTILSCAELQAKGAEVFAEKHLAADAVGGFPTDERFREAETALVEILSATNGALVMIDDLDKWIEASNYAQMLPFVEGLIYAVTEMVGGRFRHAKVRVKLFLPEDLFNKVSFRHMDKEVSYESLLWNRASLKQMVARRIAVSLSSRSDVKSEQAQDSMFSRVFPGWPKDPKCQVKDYWGVLRDPFTYALWHTHYRPRDVLFFMHTIVQTALKGGLDHIDPASVRSGVAEASTQQVKRIFQEYGQRMPYLKELIGGFKRQASCMTFKEFAGLVETRIAELDLGETLALQRAVDDLYEVGFVGKFVNPREGRPDQAPVSFQEYRGYVQFSFAETFPEFADDDQLLIHPVFWGSLRMNSPIALVHGMVEPKL